MNPRTDRHAAAAWRRLVGRVCGGLAVVLFSVIVAGSGAPGPVGRALADKGGDDGGGGDGGGDGGGAQSGAGGGGDDSGSGGGDDDSGSGGGDNSGHGGDDDFGGGDDGDDDGTDQSSSDASDHDGRDRFVADELVVINQDVAFFERVRGLGFAVVDQRPLGALGFTVTRLRLPTNLQPASARALLRRTFPDLLTDVNAVYRPQQAQVSLPAPDYARRLVGWDDAPGDCGRGVPVGLVDTGIDGALAAFAGRDIVRRSFLGAGAAPAPAGHGTAVAGLLVGGGNDAATAGLLPAAKLYLAEAFEQDADGNPAASVVGVAAALDWLVEAKVPVINLSLSGEDNLLMRIAVTRAAQRGAILVAAAGNDGPAGGPAYPGAYDEVLAVTAVDHLSQPYERANRGDYIDFAAPGVRVWAPAAGGGTYHTGSSFAAPFVTAAVAARLAAGAPPDRERIAALLAGGAVDLGAPGKDAIFGWGLVQAAASCAPGSETQ